jgi:hypothetical protein
MLPPSRLISLYHQVEFCEKNNISGAYVECGVWKGGAVGLMALANLKNSQNRRDLHLFDAFDDICQPNSEVDGKRAMDEIKALGFKNQNQGNLKPIKGIYDTLGGHGTIEICKELLIDQINYPEEKIHFHKGWFQDTLPVDSAKINEIAILRLDGDWYASTKVCLDFLYEKVVPGGFVIIDDYGHYEGCAKAVNEFLEKHQLKVYLNQVDYTCRYWIKP